MTFAIRPSRESDFAAMLAIINDAAQAYRGVIPADRWHEPYMSSEHLASEMSDGVAFWIAEANGSVIGVMGIQDRGDVALVRHAYVASTTQRSGAGTKLLKHIERLVDKPILIGTWAAASWAIGFYRRNGFIVVTDAEKDTLLRKYWSIPERQIETSVVLASTRWVASHPLPTIRFVEPSDAGEVARLFTMLGYPMDAGLAARRLESFDAAGERALVADRGDRLVGLATLHATPVLHRTGPVGRVTALVVDESVRGRGIGRALVSAAESWARARGCVLLEVTSNRKRTDAHAFYERLGYTATSFRFARDLSPD